jgi:acyl dehydratase
MTAPQTDSPSDILVFEDFAPGHFGTFGPRHVSREDILAFAAEFDPQPMHLDEEAARHSMLGGLSGSGWHLGSLTMRMMFDAFLHRAASLGSPGIETLRWTAPLRPGDDVTLALDILACRPSRSKPELGIITFKATVSNAAGTTLLEMTSPLMIRRRAALAAEG